MTRSMNEWDQAAATWDAREDVRWFAERATETLFLRVGPRLEEGWAEVRALDFGCGTGLLTEHLAARCREVVAIDPSPDMLGVLREKLERHDLSNVVALEGDLFALSEAPILGQPFDLIVASSVCAFLPDYPAALRQIANLLRPGGFFVQWDWLRADEQAGFGLTFREIEAALDEARLQVVHVGTAFVHEIEGQTEAVAMGIGCRPAVAG